MKKVTISVIFRHDNIAETFVKKQLKDFRDDIARGTVTINVESYRERKP